VRIRNQAAKLIWMAGGSPPSDHGPRQPVTPYITGAPARSMRPSTGGVIYAGATHGHRAGRLDRNSVQSLRLFHNFDSGVGRQFAFGERLKLSLIGEAFKPVNHTNVSSVSTTAFSYAAAGSGARAPANAQRLFRSLHFHAVPAADGHQQLHIWPAPVADFRQLTF